jgi:hypothetical protein
MSSRGTAWLKSSGLNLNSVKWWRVNHWIFDTAGTALGVQVKMANCASFLEYTMGQFFG